MLVNVCGLGRAPRCRSATLAHVPLLLVPLVLALLIVVLVPLSLVQRFRRGTARRPARPWVATLNLVGMSLSAVMVLTGALITGTWVPSAPAYTLAGLAGGGLLGLCGLALTHWERSGNTLHYTPNRWLVLGITLLVSARVLYGFWRTWEGWHAAIHTMTIAAASGIAASMSAGAVVIGYYLVYWAGVRWKLGRVSR